MTDSQFESLIAELRQINYNISELCGGVARHWVEIKKALEGGTEQLAHEGNHMYLLFEQLLETLQAGHEPSKN